MAQQYRIFLLLQRAGPWLKGRAEASGKDSAGAGV